MPAKAKELDLRLKMLSPLLHELELTKNLVLISTSPRKFSGEKPRRRLATFKKPNCCGGEHRLCIIFGWFTGRRRHLMKFAQFYLDQDFDVLLLTTTASQVFSPASTTKNGVKHMLEFCRNNQHYGPIVIHGFSFGAIAWGYLLHYINKNPDMFNFFHDKVVGQVWDSPFINMERLPEVGGTIAFPNSPVLQKTTENVLEFQLKLQSGGSKFFRNAVEGFHHCNTRSPFLIFSSEDDAVALCPAVAKCAEEWQNHGNTVYWKIWQRSPHVCHMKENPEEYAALLREFLGRISALKYPERFRVPIGKAKKNEDVSAASPF